MLKPAPVPKPNPNSPPNVNFTETWTFGAPPSTLSVKVGPIPFKFLPSLGGLSVWRFQCTDVDSNETKIVLKLHHERLLTPKDKFSPVYSMQQAVVEYEML